MCGITGVFWSDAEPSDLQQRLTRMQRALGHRGPDDHGLLIPRNGRFALAHTRLAILDLSLAGHQPMEDRTTGNWITYNGEIYNFRELREELSVRAEKQVSSHELSATSGPAWRSQTDTEVILKGYSRWGRDCLHHLRGMFAFALWDTHRQELFLARDPLGIKPLYFYHTDHSFLFASEIRALLSSGLVPRKLSLDGLASYLEFGSVQDPLTVIDEVKSLHPGHYVVVKLKNHRLQVEISDYANGSLGSTVSPRAATRDEAVEILRAKLEESVQLHLVSDVPVAAFLSGGIDSSAVVGLIIRVTKDRPRTFSVIFSEKGFSERSYAHIIARAFSTEHQDIPLSEQQMLEMLPRAIDAMDSPTMDGINTFVISKTVREAGIRVALSGLGGDELFAGYPSFHRAVQLRRMALIPHRLRRSASSVGRALLNVSVRHRKFWDMVQSDCSPHAAYAISRQLFAPPEIESLMRQGRYTSAVGSCNGESDPANAVSLHELRGYMANTLLRDTDQMSMAHALEVRVPFVDPVIVRYVLGLPGDWKMNSGRPKPLLLDALGNLLPKEVWQRPKMGFTLPFQQWMRSALRPQLDGALSDETALTQLGINSDYVREVWGAFKRNPEHESWSRPWSLYVFSRWCGLNDVRF